MNFHFSLFKIFLILGLCIVIAAPTTANARGRDDANDAITKDQRAADQYLEALKAINEKRHADAKVLLEKLIESQPQHAGALLDLAIMQCTLGNKQEAERLFTFLINRFAPPPAILEIIEIHRKTECVVKAPAVATNLVIEKGYDTNANQGASNSIFTIDDFGTPVNLQLLPEYLPKPDHYLSASLDLSREFGSGDGNVFLQLRGRQYNKLNNLNSAGIATGVERQFRQGNWTISPAANVSVMSLANALYQKQMSMRLKLTMPEKPDAWMKYSIATAVSRVLYPTIKNFDGSTFELRAIAAKQTDQYFLSMSAAIMRDLGNDARLGGDRHGWSISSFLRSSTPLQILNKKLFVEIGLQHLDWQSKKIYLSGLIDVKKHQSNSIVRATLGLPVTESSSIQLEYRRVLNHENISFLSFESRQIQLSWQWQQ